MSEQPERAERAVEAVEVECFDARTLQQLGDRVTGPFAWARIVWIGRGTSTPGGHKLLHTWVAQRCGADPYPWRHNRIYRIRLPGMDGPCDVKVYDIRPSTDSRVAPDEE
jgi:hypothetical protein